ncbi:MAG: hypothetical protein JRI23_21220 [Deltaproteobacteria bacterium]|nr:hypothetical protein [Deltaproteobacteria bacterium]MBW2534460.1 hypothetical protein [Deltaproteobacteria bacterium]
MTTTTMQAHLADAPDKLAVKRLKVFKLFLYLTILNNALLGLYCLGFQGGSTFAAVAAPSWAAPALGLLGVATVLSAALALQWKRWGAVGIFACGVLAVALSIGVQLFVAASFFAMGTLFWVLIARHQWSKLT